MARTLELTVELGNASPILPEGETRDAPCVTTVHIPCDPANFLYGSDDSPGSHHCYRLAADAESKTGADVFAHLAGRLMGGPGGVTHLPGYESLLAVVHPIGAWRAHSRPGTSPTFVHVSASDPELARDAEQLERLISEFFGAHEGEAPTPRGRPADLEDTHHTEAGPPGSHPPHDTGAAPGVPDVQANITQNGRDMQAKVFGGKVGITGTSTTAPAATTVTLDDQTAPGSTSAWQGQRIQIGHVWANIQSNTNATPPVLTVDRWYNPGSPGGATAATPAAGEYVVLDGVAPSWFMGLSTSTAALGTPSTNTTLPSEITTSGGGLVRQICPWAHTASTNTTTLTPVYTANGSDSLPVTVGSIGTFNSMVVGSTPNMFFNTLLPTTATLSSPGDQLTITQTITGT